MGDVATRLLTVVYTRPPSALVQVILDLTNNEIGETGMSHLVEAMHPMRRATGLRNLTLHLGHNPGTSGPSFRCLLEFQRDPWYHNLRVTG